MISLTLDIRMKLSKCFEQMWNSQNCSQKNVRNGEYQENQKHASNQETRRGVDLQWGGSCAELWLSWYRQDAKGSCDTEMRRKVVLEGPVINNVTFRRHYDNLDLKLILFSSCIVPIFTYGSESWTLTKHMENRVDACENRCILWIVTV